MDLWFEGSTECKSVSVNGSRLVFLVLCAIVCYLAIYLSQLHFLPSLGTKVEKDWKYNLRHSLTKVVTQFMKMPANSRQHTSSAYLYTRQFGLVITLFYLIFCLIPDRNPTRETTSYHKIIFKRVIWCLTSNKHFVAVVTYATPRSQFKRLCF